MSFEIQWIPSQYYATNKIANQMIIIHHTGSRNGRINSLQGTIVWFKPDPWRNEMKASAQYIIARTEQSIIQMVKDHHTSYHAGLSQWRINGILRQNLNNRSIGIELQGDGNLIDYSNFQYEAVIWLTRMKMEQFDIPVDLVQGHEHISPGRKVDPGRLFDWRYFKNAITPSSSIVVPETYPDESDHDSSHPDDGSHVDRFVENDDVQLPSGEDVPFVQRFLDLIFSIFK